MVATNEPKPRHRVPTSRYRRLEVRTWGDEKFQRLTPIPACGQGLWLYLLLGPFTTQIPGLVIGGEAAMAEALGWSLNAFRKAWTEIVGLGMAKADWSRRLVWLPNGFRHNEPANPNVVLGWRPTLLEVPECALRSELVETLRQFLEPFDEPFRESFDKASAKRLALSGSGSGSGTGDPSGGSLTGQRADPDADQPCQRCAVLGYTRPAVGSHPRPDGQPEHLCRRHLADCKRAERRLQPCSPPRLPRLTARPPRRIPAPEES